MMKTSEGKTVYLFDNGGQTQDQYTLLTEDGELYGCCVNPFDPQGIGMFCGSLDTMHTDVFDWINNARSNPGWLGNEVADWDALPEEVQRFILSKA